MDGRPQTVVYGLRSVVKINASAFTLLKYF